MTGLDTAMNSPGTSRRPASTPAKICYFLDKIPPEGRLMIYEYHFATFKLDYSTIDIYTSLQPPLLNVCKLMREEALSLYEARIRESKGVVRETREIERQRADADYDARGEIFASKEEHVSYSYRVVKQMTASMKANRAHMVELARIQMVQDGKVDPELAEWLETTGRKHEAKMGWSIGE